MLWQKQKNLSGQTGGVVRTQTFGKGTATAALFAAAHRSPHVQTKFTKQLRDIGEKNGDDLKFDEEYDSFNDSIANKEVC